MALGPDLDALDVLAKRVLAGPVELVYSFVSLTELSEYTSTEDEERARLEAEGERRRGGPAGGVADPDGGLPRRPSAPAPARAGDDRLLPHVQAPRRGRQLVLAALRGAQAADGRATPGWAARYAGRVLQLITGATGLDDWEWGVTLLADDPAVDQGHRLRDALRRGQRPLRRVRALLRGAGDGARGRARARRHPRRGLIPGSLSTRSMVTGRESASSTGQWRSAASASSS